MSNLQRLFELVRKEDVVLWVGAGFSKYAGYPVGNQLAEAIYNSLSDEDKEATAITKNLQDISEDLVNLRNGSRTQLIEILKGIYDKEPTSTKYHDILAIIPHIKTIITTNYDTLIESSYRNKCLKVLSDNDVTLIKDNIPTVVKIHGDLSNIDKIVITRSDYTEFYTTDLDTPLWHLVKERISTKTIVFLGYGLEDQNVVAIINKITSKLGNKKKESFFIAPNISPIKQGELSRKGIAYINLTGEDFITQLQENIDNNILFDVENKSVTVDTANEYISKKNIFLGLAPSIQGYSIQSITPIQGTINHNFRFSLNDKAIADKIMSEPVFEKIVISPDIISNINYTINGLRHPLSDLNNVKHIELVPVPEKTTVNFYIGSDIEFTDLPLQIYKGKGKVKFKIPLVAGDIIFNMEFPDSISENLSNYGLQLTFNHKKSFCKPNDEILFYELLLNLSRGKEIKMLTQNDLCFIFASNNTNIKLLEIPSQNLVYFKNLKLIEKHYNVIFGEIKKITETDRYNVDLLSRSIKGNLVDNDKDIAMMLEISSLPINWNTNWLNDEQFNILNKDLELCSLHNHKIEVGYRSVIINNPLYINRDEILQGKSNKLVINCKANSYVVKYLNDESLTPPQ